jgi:benzoyl-CoA reductase/2-hydroxyglutaryl-CoA dehydratase subunit BcrC/BadD/HgdB
MPHPYGELLKLCGFGEDDIQKQKSRLDQVFDRCKLGPRDFAVAEKWVRENHEVGLAGVRKILGLWLMEFVDLVLAKEDGKKIVYFGFPTITGPAMAIGTASDEVLVTCPDVVLCYSLGQIFNKLGPILEAGEENGLPPGHGLCSLQQIRVGALAKGVIPAPDMVLTSSYYCDMGSKTDELLHEVYGHPAVYVDGSMDSRWGDFPDFSGERIEYLGSQLEKIFEKAEEHLGVRVTKEALAESAARRSKIFRDLNELVELLKGADPQPISIVEIEMARRLTNGSASQRLLTEGPKAFSLFCGEVKERISKGIGVIPKGAPRVMISVAHFSDPSVTHMMENCGFSIPATLFGLLTSKGREKTPFLSGTILAQQEMQGGMFHSTYGLVKSASELTKEIRLDGIIWNYLFNCRPLSQPSHLLKRLVEKETGIPVLSLEMDIYDSRTYSAEALRTRVEAFAEMLRARQQA